jgi:hypothetical protein
MQGLVTLKEGVTREMSTPLVTWQFGFEFGRGFCAITPAPPIRSHPVWSEMVTDRPKKSTDRSKNPHVAASLMLGFYYHTPG